MMAVLTNLIPDPSMEGTSLFWDAWGSPTSYDTTSSEFWVGAKSRRLIANDGHGICPQAANAPLVDASTAYILSFYFKGSGTVQCFLQEMTLLGGSEEYNIGASIAATGSWQRFVQSFTTFGTSEKARTVIRANGSAVDVYIDGVMFHPGASAVDYFDGDTTDGGGFDYAWIGTPHESASTRTDVIVTTSDPIPRRPFNVRTNALLRR